MLFKVEGWLCKTCDILFHMFPVCFLYISKTVLQLRPGAPRAKPQERCLQAPLVCDLTCIDGGCDVVFTCCVQQFRWITPGSYPIMPLHNFYFVFFLNMVRSWSTAFLPGLWAAHGEEQLVKNPKKFTSRLDCLSLCLNLFGYGTVWNETRGIWYIKSTYTSYTSYTSH